MESQSGESASGETETGVQQTAPADASTGAAVKGEGTEKTVAGIPIKHLVLFSVGMVVAVSALINPTGHSLLFRLRFRQPGVRRWQAPARNPV